jgi:hypothetical protein
VPVRKRLLMSWGRFPFVIPGLDHPNCVGTSDFRLERICTAGYQDI